MVGLSPDMITITDTDYTSMICNQFNFKASSAINIASNAYEGCIYVGLYLKTFIELVSKGEALDKCWREKK